MKHIALVLSVAVVVVMLMAIAAPAMAHTAGVAAIAIQEKTDEKKEEEKKEEKKKEEEEKKDLPKSGGISGTDAALLGLGATVLLIGCGILVRKVVG